MLFIALYYFYQIYWNDPPKAEMPTSGDLKSGDSLFSISPLPPEI